MPSSPFRKKIWWKRQAQINAASVFQKLSPRFPAKENYFGSPTVINSPWRKVYLSNPVSTQNVVSIFPNATFQSQQVYPAFLTVPQVYGCFVAPPPTLHDTQQTDLVCLGSFAQPTWTRDVKQSVMTTVVPEHRFHPIEMIQSANSWFRTCVRINPSCGCILQFRNLERLLRLNSVKCYRWVSIVY